MHVTLTPGKYINYSTTNIHKDLKSKCIKTSKTKEQTKNLMFLVEKPECAMLCNSAKETQVHVRKLESESKSVWGKFSFC